jgi:hypothetical protein
MQKIGKLIFLRSKFALFKGIFTIFAGCNRTWLVFRRENLPYFPLSLGFPGPFSRCAHGYKMRE